MKLVILLFLLFPIAAVCEAQDIRIVKFQELKNIMSRLNDTTYVINFWATWCVPCVKEFPAFQHLATAHHSEKVKVIMVSLDFKRGIQKTIIPFIKKHPIEADVLLLDEMDYNSWLGQVDSSWQGEIPATLLLNNIKGTRGFYAHDFTTYNLSETFNLLNKTK